MAIVNYTPRNWGVRFAKEATFGTAIAVTGGTSGWITLPTQAMPKISGDVQHEDLMLTDTNRVMDSSSLRSSTINSSPTLSFATEWRRELGGHLIAAAMQTASPGNVLDTAYAHTWIQHATQPDFSVNAGYFYTVVLDAPITAQDELIKSCILQNLNIVINPPAKGKGNLVTLEGTWWSPFAKTYAQTFAATPSTPSTNFMNGSKFYCTVLGSTATHPIRSARIEITNSPFIIPTGGTAATIGFNIPFAVAKLKIEAYYNADTVALIDNADNGTNTSITLTNGVATTSYESFVATMVGRLTNDPLADASGNGVLNLEFDLVYASAEPISLVTTDDISTF